MAVGYWEESMSGRAIAVGAWRGLAKVGVFTFAVGVVLFATAGRLDWPSAWVYLGVVVAGTVIATLMVDPGLLGERAGVRAGAKSVDIPLAVFVGRVGPLMMVTVAGLDRRYGWTPALDPILSAVGLMALVLGYVFTVWAMTVNPFFSPVVRIQHDRGHVVVDRGPYRLVRHPGYVGVILVSLATPLVLGALWALVPGGLVGLVTVLRTLLEDRTLKAELPGYREYARRVRYRLLPGLW
jgi:protein-S-isoprenylcysteine O-methyltransferase Ste14